jgi:hypothetical protein
VGHILGGIKAYSLDLKRVRWPVNFKPSGIEKYDGSTNLIEWLEVYQFAIEAAGGDSYVMANYLPVVHQQLPCHLRMAKSQLGPSQLCSEERRVPLGIDPVLLQQEECPLRG